MLYEAYEARRALTAPLYGVAAAGSAVLRSLPDPIAGTWSARGGRAVWDTVGALKLTHERPDFGIDVVEAGGEEVVVHEEVVASTPFATLLRFEKDTAAPAGPPVLVVPGLAGHFATLVRGTVRTMLRDHDVYVADWHNARDVPVAAGRFGLDEYVEHVMDFLRAIGPGAHLVAVCQPCVAAIAAAAILSEDGDPAAPASLTLMAGPVDARVNPGPINAFTEKHSIERLEQRVLTTVPWPHKGRGRRVYPGFLQVAGFMAMAPRRHMSAFRGLAGDLARGRDAEAARTQDFYEEYFAVLDLAAEFYLETARVVFMEHHLARGCMRWRGRAVDPSAITSAVLTVEAENDELCPPGQTAAAHALCTGVPPERHRHHLHPGVGHYGVFSGSRFQREIYPVIRDFVAEFAPVGT